MTVPCPTVAPKGLNAGEHPPAAPPLPARSMGLVELQVPVTRGVQSEVPPDVHVQTGVCTGA